MIRSNRMLSLASAKELTRKSMPLPPDVNLSNRFTGEVGGEWEGFEGSGGPYPARGSDPIFPPDRAVTEETLP
jgi:hypothetical protein